MDFDDQAADYYVYCNSIHPQQTRMRKLLLQTLVEVYRWGSPTFGLRENILKELGLAELPTEEELYELMKERR